MKVIRIVMAVALIFGIGFLSLNTFADGGKKAKQADLDTEILNRVEAIKDLQDQINNIHLQIDSLQIGSVTYEIGDIGPAGGVVFYVTDGGLHGLEVAPEDQDSGSGAPWGCIDMHSGATGTAIGTGSSNTSSILSNCSSDGIAAKLAHDYRLSHYKDWFLPSHGELEQMVVNKWAIPHRSGGLYWSSTEYTVSGAVACDLFVNTPCYAEPKEGNKFHVRAVRAF